MEELFQAEYACFDSYHPEIRDFTFHVLSSLPETFIQNVNGIENRAIEKAKWTISQAESLFTKKQTSDLFSDKDKDVIRSALLLSDGFYYDSENGDPVSEHPLRMACYVMNDFWKKDLCDATRHVIAGAVETHSDAFNILCGQGKYQIEPKGDIAKFVYALSQQYNALFPLAIQDHAVNDLHPDADFLSALKQVQNLIGNGQWDGCCYYDDLETFIVVNGEKNVIPDSVKSAVQTYGQAVKANTKIPNGRILSYQNFRKAYPEWNGKIYEHGDRFWILPFKHSVEYMMISKEQALLLGAIV